MSDCMSFPATFDEFAEQYKIVDSKEVYTNGTELIPIFRVNQWLRHCRKKRTPVKPVMKDFHEDISFLAHSCPTCGNKIVDCHKPQYCMMCGQVLDWGDMNSTDSEIIKALECLSTPHTEVKCYGCKATNRDICSKLNPTIILDLIHRQQAEIERLKTDARDCVKEVCKSHQIDRNKAIKEFAEKLKDVFVTIDGTFECWEVEEHIDDLVNEMFGNPEQKGE